MACFLGSLNKLDNTIIANFNSSRFIDAMSIIVKIETFNS